MSRKAKKQILMTVILISMLIFGMTASADSIWDGNVSAARYGALPNIGLYGASNAFPPNTKVTVTNPKTGKSVDVIVIERLKDSNLFLTLSADAAGVLGVKPDELFQGRISEKAVSENALTQDIPYNLDPDINPGASPDEYSALALIEDYINKELGGVDESLVVTETETIPEGLPENIDAVVIEEEPVEDVLELVPEIIVGDVPVVVDLPFEEVYIEESDDILHTPDVVLKEPEAAEVPVAISMNAEAPFVTVVVPPVVVPEIPKLEADTPLISAMSNEPLEFPDDNEIKITALPKMPVIGMEEIPEDDIPIAVSMTADVVAVVEDEEIEQLLPEIAEIAIETDVPEIEELIVLEYGPEEEALIVELIPEVSVPEDIEIKDVESEPDEEISIEVEVVLEPADSRPPVIEPEEESEDEVESYDSDTEVTVVKVYAAPIAEVAEIKTPVIVEKPVAARYNLTRVLEKDSYYLQLGAYREQYSALNLADRLGKTYPMTVLVSDSSGLPTFKVMVGPLGQDESGAVLFSFKSRGYPDAFLQEGL